MQQQQQQQDENLANATAITELCLKPADYTTDAILPVNNNNTIEDIEATPPAAADPTHPANTPGSNNEAEIPEKSTTRSSTGGATGKEVRRRAYRVLKKTLSAELDDLATVHFKLDAAAESSDQLSAVTFDWPSMRAALIAEAKIQFKGELDHIDFGESANRMKQAARRGSGRKADPQPALPHSSEDAAASSCSLCGVAEDCAHEMLEAKPKADEPDGDESASGEAASADGEPDGPYPLNVSSCSSYVSSSSSSDEEVSGTDSEGLEKFFHLFSQAKQIRTRTILPVVDDKQPVQRIARILELPAYNANRVIQTPIPAKKIVSLMQLSLRHDNEILVEIKKSRIVEFSKEPNSKRNERLSPFLDLSSVRVNHTASEFFTFCSCPSCMRYREVIINAMVVQFKGAHMVVMLLDVLIKAYGRMLKNATAYNKLEVLLDENKKGHWLTCGGYTSERNHEFMDFIYDDSLADNMVLVLFSTTLMVNNPMQLLQVLAFHMQCILRAYAEGFEEVVTTDKNKIPAEAMLNYILEGYDYMCRISEQMSCFLFTFENDFLRKLGATWKTICQRLYYQYVYSKLSETLLTCLFTLKVDDLQAQYGDLIRRYIAFDESMGCIDKRWTAIWMELNKFNMSEAQALRRQSLESMSQIFEIVVQDAIAFKLEEGGEDDNFFDFQCLENRQLAWQNIMAYTKMKWPNGFVYEPNTYVCENRCSKCTALLEFHEKNCKCVTCSIGGSPLPPQRDNLELCGKCAALAARSDPNCNLYKSTLLNRCAKDDAECLSPTCAAAATTGNTTGNPNEDGSNARPPSPTPSIECLRRQLKLKDVDAAAALASDFSLLTTTDSTPAEPPPPPPMEQFRYHISHAVFHCMKNRRKYKYPQVDRKYFCQDCKLLACMLARKILNNEIDRDLSLLMVNNYRSLPMRLQEIRSILPNMMFYNHKMVANRPPDLHDVVVKTYWTFILSIYATYFVAFDDRCPMNLECLVLRDGDIFLDQDKFTGDGNDKTFETFLENIKKLSPFRSKVETDFAFTVDVHSEDMQKKLDDFLTLYERKMPLSATQKAAKTIATGQMQKASNSPPPPPPAPAATPEGPPKKARETKPRKCCSEHPELAEHCKEAHGKRRVKKVIKDCGHSRMNETRERLRKKLACARKAADGGTAECLPTVESLPELQLPPEQKQLTQQQQQQPVAAATKQPQVKPMQPQPTTKTIQQHLKQAQIQEEQRHAKQIQRQQRMLQEQQQQELQQQQQQHQQQQQQHQQQQQQHQQQQHLLQVQHHQMQQLQQQQAQLQHQQSLVQPQMHQVAPPPVQYTRMQQMHFQPMPLQQMVPQQMMSHQMLGHPPQLMPTQMMVQQRMPPQNHPHYDQTQQPQQPQQPVQQARLPQSQYLITHQPGTQPAYLAPLSLMPSDVPPGQPKQDIDERIRPMDGEQMGVATPAPAAAAKPATKSTSQQTTPRCYGDCGNAACTGTCASLDCLNSLCSNLSNLRTTDQQPRPHTNGKPEPAGESAPPSLPKKAAKRQPPAAPANGPQPRPVSAQELGLDISNDEDTDSSVDVDQWVADRLNFIEGGKKQPPKTNPKKAAKKAKQKMRREEEKRIGELVDLRGQFQDIYFKEFTNKHRLKAMKGSKKRDKKQITELEANIKKLQRAKAKVETTILELIATVKQTNTEFKFPYLPTKEQQTEKLRELESPPGDGASATEAPAPQPPHLVYPGAAGSGEGPVEMAQQPAYAAPGHPHYPPQYYNFAPVGHMLRPVLPMGMPMPVGMPMSMMGVPMPMPVRICYAPPPNGQPTAPQQPQMAASYAPQQQVAFQPPTSAAASSQTDMVKITSNAGAPGDKPIVTIRRVNMQAGPQEDSKVTVTAKGSSPDQDELLYTFVNGQLMQAPPPPPPPVASGVAAAGGNSLYLQPAAPGAAMTKTQRKKERKRLLKQAAEAEERRLEQERIEQEAREREAELQREKEAAAAAATAAKKLQQQQQLEQQRKAKGKGKKKQKKKAAAQVASSGSTTSVSTSDGRGEPAASSHQNFTTSVMAQMRQADKNSRQSTSSCSAATSSSATPQSSHVHTRENSTSSMKPPTATPPAASPRTSTNGKTPAVKPGAKKAGKAQTQSVAKAKLKPGPLPQPEPEPEPEAQKKPKRERSKPKRIVDNGQFDNNPYKSLHLNESDASDSDEESSASSECSEDEQPASGAVAEVETFAEIAPKKPTKAAAAPAATKPAKENKPSAKAAKETKSSPASESSKPNGGAGGNSAPAPTKGQSKTTAVARAGPNQRPSKAVEANAKNAPAVAANNRGNNTNPSNNNNNSNSNKKQAPTKQSNQSLKQPPAAASLTQAKQPTGNASHQQRGARDCGPAEPQQSHQSNRRNGRNSNAAAPAGPAPYRTTADKSKGGEAMLWRSQEQQHRANHHSYQPSPQQQQQQAPQTMSKRAQKAAQRKQKFQEIHQQQHQNQQQHHQQHDDYYAGIPNNMGYFNEHDAAVTAAAARAATASSRRQQIACKEPSLAKQMAQLQLEERRHGKAVGGHAAAAVSSGSSSANSTIMDQLSRGVQVENLSLPPGITLTKLDPAKSEELRQKSESIKKLAQPLQQQQPVAMPPTHFMHGGGGGPSATIIAPPLHGGGKSYYDSAAFPGLTAIDPHSGIIMVEPAATAAAKQQARPPPEAGAPKTGKNKKRRNKNAKGGGAPADSSDAASVNSPKVELAADGGKPKMVTLRNPMFHGGLPSAPASIITPKPAGMAPASVGVLGNAAPTGVPMQLPVDQPAAIIKNENGMFTIRNPALHQAVTNGLVMGGYRQFSNYYTPQEAAAEATAATQQKQQQQQRRDESASGGGSATPFSYFSNMSELSASEAAAAGASKLNDSPFDNFGQAAAAASATANTADNCNGPSMRPTGPPPAAKERKCISAIGSEMKQHKHKDKENDDSRWRSPYLPADSPLSTSLFSQHGLSPQNLPDKYQHYFNGYDVFGGPAGRQPQPSYFDRPTESHLQTHMHHNCGEDSPPPTVKNFTSTYLDGIPNTGVIRYDDASFLKNLIPGQNLNNEVSIHNVSDSNFGRATSPVAHRIEITPVYNRGGGPNGGGAASSGETSTTGVNDVLTGMPIDRYNMDDMDMSFHSYSDKLRSFDTNSLYSSNSSPLGLSDFAEKAALYSKTFELDSSNQTAKSAGDNVNQFYADFNFLANSNQTGISDGKSAVDTTDGFAKIFPMAGDGERMGGNSLYAGGGGGANDVNDVKDGSATSSGGGGGGGVPAGGALGCVADGRAEVGGDEAGLMAGSQLACEASMNLSSLAGSAGCQQQQQPQAMTSADNNTKTSTDLWW